MKAISDVENRLRSHYYYRMFSSHSKKGYHFSKHSAHKLIIPFQNSAHNFHLKISFSLYQSIPPFGLAGLNTTALTNEKNSNTWGSLPIARLHLTVVSYNLIISSHNYNNKQQ